MLTWIVALGFLGVILAILFPKYMRTVVYLGFVYALWSAGGVWAWVAAGLFVYVVAHTLIEWGVLPDDKPVDPQGNQAKKPESLLATWWKAGMRKSGE